MKTYTPAQSAAIAIVHTVPRTICFGAVSVTCDDLLIGHVDPEYVAELTVTASASPAKPELVFGERIRGGVKMGVVDSIAVVTDDDDVHVIEMADRRIKLSIPPSGEFVSISDEYETVSIAMEMIDAHIASLLALKARAGHP